MRTPIQNCWLVTAIAMLSLSACRGQSSRKPPLRLIKDMTEQPSARSYSAAAQRAINGAAAGPTGVIAIEQEHDIQLESLRSKSGDQKLIPVVVDAALLDRGRLLFDVHCSPCHDSAGNGQGVIAQKGFPSPIDLASANTLGLADGQLYEILTKGIRNMPAPNESLSGLDRWALVAWIRVLQRSRTARLADLSVEPTTVEEP